MVKKVIDYTEYFNAQNYNNNNKTAAQVSAIVMNIQPKIASLLDDEIAKMSVSKEIYESFKTRDDIQDHFDLTVITSLCYILAQYLIALSQRQNTLGLDEGSLESFTVNLIKKMLNTFEKDE